MSKKFVGENTKAVAAKEKKLKAKTAECLKEEEERVDQEWADTSKVVKKKLKRREDKEVKRQEQLKRKNELRDLLKKESPVINKLKIKVPKKLTIQDIQKKLALEKTKNAQIKKNETHLTVSLTENLNRLSIGEEIARTIDQALSMLNEDTQDRHPEKRLKAGHKAFEEKRLKELKAIHPTLKLSQLKEIIFKEWQKMQ